MEEKGMSKNIFARECFIAINSLKKILAGKPVGVKVILKIANYMQKEYYEMFL